MAAPVIVDSGIADVQAYIDRLPPERRQHVVVGPPERAAEGLRPYIEAGFSGFTFNNTIYRTPESIEAVGEVLRLVS